MYVEEDIRKRREEIANNIAKSFNEDFCKAHNHGDIHPNGKWYWESSANGGKGDWRAIKKTTTSVTPKDVYNDIRFINPSQSVVSSLGSVVTQQDKQLAESEKRRIVKFLPKDSLAYKILSERDSFSDKQLWVIAYELVKNKDYQKHLAKRIEEINKQISYEQARKSAKKQARKQAEKNISNKQIELKSGDIVEHPKFGIGKVLSLTVDKVTVEFDQNGQHVLLRKYAPLKKVNS